MARSMIMKLGSTAFTLARADLATDIVVLQAILQDDNTARHLKYAAWGVIGSMCTCHCMDSPWQP